MKRDFSLDDKYTLEEGVIYATGVQALVRLPMDQERLDRRRGLRTAGFISGYPGSPLGTYDLALGRAAELLRRHHIVHVPGVNEELAATAVFGSQLTHLFPGQRFEGVVGYWYGKGPGVDRSGDALRHANFAGTGAKGGAVLFVGDDPVAKSSTLPSGSETLVATLGLPVLYPGSTQEVLDLGLHAVALSRFSGSWVALKMVNNVCDGGGTAVVAPDRIDPQVPEWTRPELAVPEGMRHMLVPAVTVPAEAHVYHHRLEAAAHYARCNGLNRITVNPRPARLGLMAGGKTYRDLVQALAEMGLDDEALRQAGIRLLRLGLLHPLDRQILQEFAQDLEEIVVVEEKRPFLELQVRDALYSLPRRPRVVGKFDADEAPLVPMGGGLSPDAITAVLAPRLLPYAPLERVKARLAELQEAEEARSHGGAAVVRTNNFCSGCPHNRSTLLLEGQLAGGGIGCHTMAVMTGQRERSFEFVTQMGGEGAVWIGASPFVEHPHLFQNLGDGTYFHSGRLGVEAAIASGTKMTFKILYNGHVSMTGGQDPAGALPIPALTRELDAMGASKIFLVAEDAESHRRRRQELAPDVSIHHRDDLEEVLALCEATPGVSILIYDQPCAAERRRRRRRGLVPTPRRHIVINEEVCEGCGDCGEKSNCMSVVPVETELGRKTAVHLSSCNQDELCLKGDCPAFVVVETRGDAPGRERAVAGKAGSAPVVKPPPLETFPEPQDRAEAGAGYTVLMTGVGGTGVVTANALLAVTALLEGKHCSSLDQIGLAQKGGAVLSSLVIADEPVAGSGTPSTARVDLLLGLDVLGAANPENLILASPARTAAVVNTTGVATAEMVRNRSARFPGRSELEAGIARRTDPRRTVFVDAGDLVENLFHDHMMTNVFCLGVAYQRGFLPLRGENLEEAIRLNGVAVEKNLAALRWGRCLVVDPDAVKRFATSAAARPGGDEGNSDADDGGGGVELATAHEAALADLEVAGKGARKAFQELQQGLQGSAELRRRVELRLANLILYQDADYARQYLDFVEGVRLREARFASGHRGGEALTTEVARYLYKLMANKDEYEVARLHLRPGARERIRRLLPGVVRTSIMLHPPTLRRLGLKSKVPFGPFLRPLLHLLARMKGLRGTALDFFGRSEMRRLERSLPAWYRDLVERALDKLSSDNLPVALALARLPDDIRGYEEIRLRAIREAQARAAQYLDELDPPHHRVAV